MSIALEILESEIVNNHSKINIIDKAKSVVEAAKLLQKK
jgi:hypothetical protein